MNNTFHDLMKDRSISTKVISGAALGFHENYMHQSQQSNSRGLILNVHFSLKKTTKRSPSQYTCSYFWPLKTTELSLLNWTSWHDSEIFDSSENFFTLDDLDCTASQLGRAFCLCTPDWSSYTPGRPRSRIELQTMQLQSHLWSHCHQRETYLCNEYFLYMETLYRCYFVWAVNLLPPLFVPVVAVFSSGKGRHSSGH